MSELRLAIRSLFRSPGFALAALATLALGVGANAAIFSVVNAVLIRPLPYPGADRLVQLLVARGAEVDESFAPANYLDLERDLQAIAPVAAYREAAFDLATAGRDTQRFEGVFTTERYFDVFAVRPVRGRLYQAGDRATGRRVAVLSEGAWRRAFGADDTIIGRQVRFGGQPYEIVGVVAANMTWPDKPDVFVLADQPVPPPPLEVRGDVLTQRGLSYFNVVGRLRGGQTQASARQDVDMLAGRLARDFPENNAERQIRVVPLQERLVGDVRQALLVLLGAVGLVLLIAAGNVAHLLLARAAVRHREFAVRSALGAGTWRIARQVLTEGLVLAAMGGALGLLVGHGAVRLLVALAPRNVPRLDEVGLDLRVLGFTAMVSLAAAVVFALAPVVQTRRIDLVDALKSGGRTETGGGSRVFRRGLVMGEVALASMLLVGAGLFLHSFWRLSRVDPGFARERVVTIEQIIPESRYDTREKQARFYRAFVDGLLSTPTVRQAAAGFPQPFGGGTSSSAPFQVEGRPEATGANRPMALLGIAMPDYFRTLGIPLQRGRDFSDRDHVKAEPVVIVDEALARTFFPGENPVDRRINIGGDQWWRIVGVVGDHRRKDMSLPPEPTVYLPYEQFTLPFMSVYVRTTADTARLTADARTVLRQIDPDLALQDVRDMSDVVTAAVAVPRFRTLLIALFAALALVLAAVGIYGVVSYSTAQRAREFGIRLALGASPRQLLAFTLRDGLVMAAGGLALGLFGAWVAGRVLASLLYEVAPTDPVTFAAVPVLLAGIALIACLRPARQAARVDPVVTLRAD